MIRNYCVVWEVDKSLSYVWSIQSSKSDFSKQAEEELRKIFSATSLNAWHTYTKRKENDRLLSTHIIPQQYDFHLKAGIWPKNFGLSESLLLHTFYYL